MSEKKAIDDGKEIERSIPTVVVAASVTVACLHWIPLLVFFFSVPLFIVFFSKGTRVYIAAIFATLVLDCVVAVFVSGFQGYAINRQEMIRVISQSFFLFLPLLCVIVPGKIRIRYRLALAGTISAIAWIALFTLTDVGAVLSSLMRDVSEQTSEIFNAMIPEGFERSAFQAQLDPTVIYNAMNLMLRGTVLPLCILLYSMGYVVGSAITRGVLRNRAVRFEPIGFYNDFFVFIPLVGGMCGVIGAKLLGSENLNAISWNLFCVAGIFFTVQGYGIFLFFLNKVRVRIGKLTFVVIVAAFFVILLNTLFFFLGGLLIVGVLELFVPIRTRFNNNGTVDPTPGGGGDHNE